MAYNNYIGYPVLFYNDNNVDLLSFDNISHYIKNLINNPSNFYNMLIYKKDYNKFIKCLFKNPIFIDWLKNIFSYIYNNDIKNIYNLIFFTSDTIDEFLNHYTQYNDNYLKHEGFRI